MKALVRTSTNNVRLVEAAIPAIAGADEVLVRVAAAGVCATDLAIAEGAFGGATQRILGHEVAGVVEKAGPRVEGLAKDDKVVVQPTIPCGHCSPCHENHPHLCPNRQFIGLDRDGGFAEWIVVPAGNLVKVPASMPMRAACLVEPVACVLHALDCLGKVPRRGVIIAGAGFSAFLFVQAFMAAGVAPEKIMVSGRRKKRLEIIVSLGAHAVDARRDSLSDRSRQIFGEAGPDIFIDQTGDPELLRQSLDMVGRKGILFIYDFTGHDIPFNFGAMQLREIAIKTSTGCPDTMDRALRLMEEGVINVSSGVTHVFGKTEMDRAFATLTDKNPEHVKSVIDFNL